MLFFYKKAIWLICFIEQSGQAHVTLPLRNLDEVENFVRRRDTAKR